MNDQKNISITACTTDTKALGAIGRMFLDLAGEQYGLSQGWELMNVAASEISAPAAATSLEPVLAAAANEADLLRPVDAFTPAPVDTAAVFGGIDLPVLSPAPVAVPAPPTPAPFCPADTMVVLAAPPAAPTGVALDKSGLPWDSRINTSNKTQTAKGIWKRAPGLTDDLYQGALTELRGIMAAPAPVAPIVPAAAPAPPADLGPAADPWNAANQAAAAVVPAPPAAAAVVPAPPAAAPVAPAPPAAPTDAPASYAQLLGVVAQRIQGGSITHAEVTGACVAAGLPDLNSVAARPDLIPSIYAGLVAIWSTRA